MLACTLFEQGNVALGGGSQKIRNQVRATFAGLVNRGGGRVGEGGILKRKKKGGN